MKVLVAGGAGFIGSHLCERLLQDGADVICVDNLLTGSADNILPLRGGRFTFVQHDVTDPLALDGVDYVLHLASPASPRDYHEHPIASLRAGALGTFNLLELARRAGARFVLASTSEVYGDPKEHPQREEYWGNVNPVGPRSVYDEAKRFAEAVTMAYHRQYGMNTGIGRIFNTYGPRMRGEDGRAVPTFIVQALRGEPLTVHGDGSQTRSLCYVSDLVEGFVALVRSDVHEPVNLGNPEEITIRDVARLIVDLTGSGSTLTFTALPADDPKVRRPDIARARSLLRWEPKVALHDGLRRTIDWFAARVPA